MRRGHTQRESKVLRQQLRQVKWNNGVTGHGEERRGKLVENLKKKERDEPREGTEVNLIQL